MTSQRMPKPDALCTPGTVFLSWKEQPKHNPHVPIPAGSAELTSRRSSCSREGFRHPHTSTEHCLLHCSPPPNQQHGHHPSQISPAPPSWQAPDVGVPHQHLHTVTERTSAPPCSCCPAKTGTCGGIWWLLGCLTPQDLSHLCQPYTGKTAAHHSCVQGVQKKQVQSKNEVAELKGEQGR